jgi:lysozyme
MKFKKSIVYLLCFLFFFIVLFIYNFKIFFLNDYKIRGIDISHYQNVKNWNLISQSNRFCIMKATQGNKFVDPTFHNYWLNAKKNKLVRGAYHYFAPNISAEKQFENFRKQVKLVTNDLPPILDIEEKEVDMNEANKWLQLAENYYGVKPIVYSSYNFYLIFMKGRINQYPLWLYFNKRFTLRPALDNCIMLQYDQYGTTEGITGDVDLDVFLGNDVQFKKLLVK